MKEPLTCINKRENKNNKMFYTRFRFRIKFKDSKKCTLIECEERIEENTQINSKCILKTVLNLV